MGIESSKTEQKSQTVDQGSVQSGFEVTKKQPPKIDALI
jgi:hypothetical protein